MMLWRLAGFLLLVLSALWVGAAMVVFVNLIPHWQAREIAWMVGGSSATVACVLAAIACFRLANRLSARYVPPAAPPDPPAPPGSFRALYRQRVAERRALIDLRRKLAQEQPHLDKAVDAIAWIAGIALAVVLLELLRP